jgi:predicted amidohydrolase
MAHKIQDMVRIAGIQFRCGKDPETNIQKATEMASLAVERGARIVGFPQMSVLPWFAFESNRGNFRYAEPLDGPTVSAFRDFSKRHRAVTVCSFFERDGEEFYNTAVVIENDGRVLGRYRKVHLPQIPLWEERTYFKPGDQGFPVFQTSCARIGIQICWDNFFPEGTRILALRGAQIVFAPTASAFASQKRWERMICANAIANNLFILRINRVGKEERQQFYGKTFCANPFGELVGSRAGSEDAIVFSDIDLNEVAETRKIWTFFEDRRPDLYGELLQP